MKKALFTGAVISLLCVPTVAFAKGTASVKFEGTNNINIGDEFTVNMIIDNINDTNEEGIVGIGGYITFDGDVLELVETNQGDSYEILINRKNNKFIGIDYTMANGIKERTNVFKLTFRSKAIGNTNITLTDGELEDRYSSVDFDVNGLYVTSNEKVEEIIEEKVEVEEVKTEEKIEEKTINYIEKEEEPQTPEYVETDNVEIKKEKVVKKATKNTKKVAKKVTKKTAKKKKNIIEIVKSFFTNIIKM